jgi:NAD(P) transhydrogenase subunit alpha
MILRIWLKIKIIKISMKILVLKETDKLEKRIALTPDLITKYKKLNPDLRIYIESGIGQNIKISDSDYHKNGAEIVADINQILPEIDIIISLKRTDLDFSKIKKQCLLISALNPYLNLEKIESLAKSNISGLFLELLPRITRSQSMDILSSQNNLAGYRAVINGFYELQKIIPMMITAAGTVAPAKVMILGAGVAGLQAIATAKRMGAIVFAFDVRSSAKEQVESLGAKFIEVVASKSATNSDGETKSGYAKEMDEEYKKQQEKAIYEQIINADLVISTALIPGKKAPILITKDMVDNMKPGSIIIDLAASNGGNCALSKKGGIIEFNNVRIIAYDNILNFCAFDASKLIAKNIFNFVELLASKESKDLHQVIYLDLEDEIIKSTLACNDGKVLLNSK